VRGAIGKIGRKLVRAFLLSASLAFPLSLSEYQTDKTEERKEKRYRRDERKEGESGGEKELGREKRKGKGK
jgi:hypothetical protein